MKREYRIILELCKFCSPDKEKIKSILSSPLDYPFVLGQLLYNRMGAVAYHTLEICGLMGGVNREFCNTLQKVYEADAIKTEGFTQAVEMISQVLGQADFPYALLKGAYLTSIYPKGLRTSNDIDILVGRGHISKLAGLLAGNGFMQGHLRNGKFIPAARLEIISSRMNRGETVPFVKEVGLPGMKFCEVDINFSLDSVAYQEGNAISTMLGDRSKLIYGRAYTLSKWDFMIHLCVHLFKEATVINWVEMGRDLSLYKFCDLYLLIEKWMDEEFLKAVRHRIHNYELERECYYALYLTREFFQVENSMLDTLLCDIQPSGTRYMREVVDVATGKKYIHDQSFMEWLFCGRRREGLREITDGKD